MGVPKDYRPVLTPANPVSDPVYKIAGRAPAVDEGNAMPEDPLF